MASEHTSPYLVHIFVCTNDRHGERPSCADGKGAELRQCLKQGVEERGLKPRVRLSSSGCLGLCAKGPNVLIYPQGIWLAGQAPDDAPAILDRVEALLNRG
ncbi:MAG: (2Fe-2S) ferredoxin domain-containing protein [Pseudomonadota bacterium]